MFKVQKGNKDIIKKMVLVTSVAQPQFYEATRILFVCKENKNNNFIQHIFYYFIQQIVELNRYICLFL